MFSSAMSALLVLLLACVAPACAAGAGAGTSTVPVRHPVEIAYDQAVAAAASADWEACLDATRRALALAPGQPALQRRHAEALAQLGRSDEAMQDLRALVGWGVEVKLADFELLAPLHGHADWPQLLAAAEAALAPQGSPGLSFTMPVADLVPEGICHDPVDDVFYVSSVAQRKILRVARDGTASDFIASGAHGYLAGLGVAVDAQRRRLWAVSTAQADDGLFDGTVVFTSAVHVFDLASGKLLWRHVTAQRDSLGFNDVCVLPDGGGAVAVTDRGQVLRFGPDGGAPVALTAPGAMPGANGLCVGPRGDCLYVSAYLLGIMRVDLDDGVISAAAVPGADFTTSGVDGLYLLPDGTGLIAVQNFLGLDRVARFRLRADGLVDDCRVLTARQEMFVDPTTGALAADGFHFIADSYVSPFYGREDKSVLTGFGRTRVMRIGLE
jgi:sugar lactone lactonase YvrE